MPILTIVLLAAIVVAAPGVVQAQSPAKVYRIGVFTDLSVEDAPKLWQASLRERGYIEGKNAVFEVRAAAEKFNLLRELVTELMEAKVDIILTTSTPTALAAKQVTSTTPIVTFSGDPVGAGLVTSLAHPGGNVTGVYVPVVEMAPKRLQLLKEAVPGLSSVAILWNPHNSASQVQAKATEAAARSLGLTTFFVEITNESSLHSALQLLHTRRPSGFIVMQDPVLHDAAKTLAEFAIKNKIPAFHNYRAFADAGGLMSYGVSRTGLYETGATYVDKILKGAKPADLPMEQPSRYEFVVNLKTAKRLGITIPQSILLRADEVIK